MKAKLPPLIMLAFGLVGFALQVWTQNTAFEEGTRLVLSGQPALIDLKLYFCAVPVLALIASLSLKGKGTGEARSLCAGMGRGSLALGLLAGALVLAGGLLQLARHLPSALPGGSWMSFGVCAVDLALSAAGACMLWLSLAGRRPDWTGRSAPATLVPGFAGCFWLVVFYHNNSQDPVIARYCWLLLALLAAILALYFQAAYAFQRHRPVLAQTCTLTALAYALAAIPSAQEWGEKLLLLGMGLWMLLNALLIAGQSGGGEPAAEPDGE